MAVRRSGKQTVLLVSSRTQPYVRRIEGSPSLKCASQITTIPVLPGRQHGPCSARVLSSPSNWTVIRFRHACGSRPRGLDGRLARRCAGSLVSGHVFRRAKESSRERAFRRRHPPTPPASARDNQTRRAPPCVPLAPLSHTAPAAEPDDISLPAICADIPECSIAYPARPGRPTRTAP